MRDVNERMIGELERLFADKLHVEVPSADTDLIETGLLDSLRLVELLLQIETHLGWRLPLDEIDLADLRTVRRMAQLIAARTALQESAA